MHSEVSSQLRRNVGISLGKEASGGDERQDTQHSTAGPTLTLHPCLASTTVSTQPSSAVHLRRCFRTSLRGPEYCSCLGYSARLQQATCSTLTEHGSGSHTTCFLLYISQTCWDPGELLEVFPWKRQQAQKSQQLPVQTRFLISTLHRRQTSFPCHRTVRFSNECRTPLG